MKTALVEPVITFQEYVLNVVGSPQRGEELRVLIQLFGMPYIEKIMAGTVTVKPEHFYKSVGGK
jgi:hypothetical protein